MNNSMQFDRDPSPPVTPNQSRSRVQSADLLHSLSYNFRQLSNEIPDVAIEEQHTDPNTTKNHRDRSTSQDLTLYSTEWRKYFIVLTEWQKKGRIFLFDTYLWHLYGKLHLNYVDQVENEL